MRSRQDCCWLGAVQQVVCFPPTTPPHGRRRCAVKRIDSNQLSIGPAAAMHSLRLVGRRMHLGLFLFFSNFISCYSLLAPFRFYFLFFLFLSLNFVALCLTSLFGLCITRERLGHRLPFPAAESILGAASSTPKCASALFRLIAYWSRPGNWMDRLCSHQIIPPAGAREHLESWSFILPAPLLCQLLFNQPFY